MSEKKSLTKVFVEKYLYSSKREKMIILDEFVDYTGFRFSRISSFIREARISNPEFRSAPDA
jgi:hypothetical protein